MKLGTQKIVSEDVMLPFVILLPEAFLRVVCRLS